MKCESDNGLVSGYLGVNALAGAAQSGGVGFTLSTNDGVTWTWNNAGLTSASANHLALQGDTIYLPSDNGIYQLQAGSYAETKRLLILK